MPLTFSISIPLAECQKANGSAQHLDDKLSARRDFMNVPGIEITIPNFLSEEEPSGAVLRFRNGLRPGVSGRRTARWQKRAS